LSVSRSSQARPLTLIIAIAIVVANMIGTGIFTSTGFQSADLGGSLPQLIAWAAGGVFALCGAAVYGELGAMMPRAGGEYVYLREAFHESVGFLSGWVSLIVGFAAPVAVSAMAFGKYLHWVVPDVSMKLAAVSIIVLLSAMHMASVVVGAKAQTAFSILKVSLILVFVGASVIAGKGDWSNLRAGHGLDKIASGAFAVSLYWIAFSYSGWNAAAYIAGEIRDPGRNLPRALFIGTAIVMALYLLLNAVFFYAAPPAVLAKGAGDGPVVEVGAFTAQILFGEGAGKVLAALIALLLISAVSAMIMAGPRIYMAMAEDGAFPRVFAWRSRSGAPVYSILLQSALSVALLLTSQFDHLVKYIGFTLTIFAALSVIGAFVLRAKRPNAERPYRTIGWPVTPVLFISLSAWMVYYGIKLEPKTALWGGVTLASGALVYALWCAVNPRMP
jgi:APA family basic amino acid/polyamine antiporter